MPPASLPASLPAALPALLLCCLASMVHALPAGWTRHMPHPGAVVSAGPARFTVIHPHIIRMEYAPSPSASGAPSPTEFDDRPTITIQDRRPFPLPHYEVERRPGGGLAITTAGLQLEWTGAGPFSPDTLTVSLRTYPFTTWHPGTPNTGNLHGTIRTLDRVGEPLDLTCKPPRTTMEFYAHCEPGLVSRDGWVVVDDSVRPRVQLSKAESRDEGRHVLEDWPWPVSPPPANIRALQAGAQPPYQDLYFFGFGLNHTGAVSAFTAMSGPIPLLPRYALGAGFSRWYAYGQLEELEGSAGPAGQGGLLSSFEGWGVPLDMLSIDMDWHTTGPRGERAHPLTGEANEGWTGWSWAKTLFPAPAALMKAAARRGVAVNLNQHPADGVAFDEDAYPATAAAVGIDPTSLVKVEFDPANQSYVSALLQHVLKPLDDTGLAFWWQDFQHGPFSAVPLLNPTYLTNLYLWENPWRYGGKVPGRRLPGTGDPSVSPSVQPYVDRPFLFGRWSGLGSHRMPIGFAGDTAVKWRVLRYESYFDATASNAAFMWSNDIGGFEGAPPPELMVRWSQWGALSAMLRGHSSKMSPPRTAWSFPHPYFGAIRQAWRLRAALLPYLASSQRTSHETGLQLMQPMYWHYPAAAPAYGTQAQHQYFLGPGRRLWVAPIAAPRVDDGSAAEADVPLHTRLQQDAADARAGKVSHKHAVDTALAQHAGRVPWTMWVPPGTWVEWGSWQAVRGDATPSPTAGAGPAGRTLPSAYNTGPGSFVSRNYSLSEIPMFSPPGAIIPQRVLPGTGSAARGPEHPSSVLGLATAPLSDLALWVMPLAPPADDGTGSGSSAGSESRYGPWPLPAEGWGGATGVLSSTAGTLTSTARLFEEDGLTQAVEDGWFADTEVQCTWARGAAEEGQESGGLLSGIGRMFGASSASSGETVDTLTCLIREPSGKGYPGHPASRVLTWRFLGVWPPSSIEVDGAVMGQEARDQAACPDNTGEHGAWQQGVNSWAYHGPSASVWVHVGAPVPTRKTAASAAVGADGSSRASTSTGSTSSSGAAVHTVKLRFERGARLDDPLLTRYGTHRMVSRSLACKEEVDRSYGVVYPTDVPYVLNVSAGAVLLGQAGSAAEAKAVLQGMVGDLGQGVEGVARWTIPPSQRTMLTLQHHCLGALYDGLALPTPLPADDPRAVAAARPLTFTAGISNSKGSAPGMVSQHEETAPAPADDHHGHGHGKDKEKGKDKGHQAEVYVDDEWEGKGWRYKEGGVAVPPAARK